MSADQSPIIASLIAYVSIVALVDIYTHRIPNALNASAAALALITQMWLHGSVGVLSALSGAAVALCVFLPLYVMRAFGAGDVKAMATIGLFLGAKLTLLSVAFTLVAGGIMGAIVLCATTPSASAAVHRMIGVFVAPLSVRRAAENASASQPRVQRFPYGVAIAAGTIATLLIGDPIQLPF